jgi:AmiR/NasT family two-component response regulator
MQKSLHIAIAHNDLATLTSLHSSVTQLGHSVCFDATSGREFVEKSKSHRPDLMIVQDRLPDGEGLQAAREAARSDAIPTILIIGTHNGELLDRSKSENVLAVLHEPVRQSDLAPALAIAMQRFEQLQKLRNQIESLKHDLETGY